MPLHLTQPERDLLSGASGDATAMAMRVVTSAAELLAAESLVEVTSAHIDGCLHHIARIDFGNLNNNSY